MIGGKVSNALLPVRLLPAEPGQLSAAEIDDLWPVFVHIGKTWGDPEADPLYQRSQWIEFLQVKTEKEPSYLAEYRNARDVLAELQQLYGEAMWQKLFFEHGVSGAPASRLAHFRVFVVEEFIKVWLTSGGFKTYGAGNYNSYISGSRFAVLPPYRLVSSPEQAPNPQTGPPAPPQEK